MGDRPPDHDVHCFGWPDFARNRTVKSKKIAPSRFTSIRTKIETPLSARPQTAVFFCLLTGIRLTVIGVGFAMGGHGAPPLHFSSHLTSLVRGQARGPVPTGDGRQDTDNLKSNWYYILRLVGRLSHAFRGQGLNGLTTALDPSHGDQSTRAI